jgi:Cdc6-like AAA superfamily ATPase
MKEAPYAFRILLNSDYNEGSPYGRVFDTIDPKTNRSTIYVEQAEIESQLDAFIGSTDENLHYLIGFAGIGKTTLLRNYFSSFKRDVVLNNGNLVLYISFHSIEDDGIAIDADYTQDNENTNSYAITSRIKETIIEFMRRAVEIAVEEFGDGSNSYSKDFFDSFYKEIGNSKKPHFQLIESYLRMREYTFLHRLWQG